MNIEEKKWKNIKKLFTKAVLTTGHFAFATTDNDGKPHVTPITSLALTDNCKGYYFEEYPTHMVKNLKENKQICIMAVNSSKWSLIKALIKGKTSEPISIRLIGTVGEKREATQREQQKFLKFVWPYKWTRGYKMIWKNLNYVRDIDFTSYESVKVGALTSKQEI